jgi:hypothetical protein
MIRLLSIIILVSKLRSWKIKLEFGGVIQFFCWMAPFLLLRAYIARLFILITWVFVVRTSHEHCTCSNR